MSGRVSVWKYVRIGKKLRYYNAWKHGNINPDWVIVGDKEEHPQKGTSTCTPAPVERFIRLRNCVN